jgi:hypothetical protein
LAVGVIDAGERIDPVQSTSSAGSVKSVVNAHFVGLENFGSSKTSHRFTWGLSGRKNQCLFVPYRIIRRLNSHRSRNIGKVSPRISRPRISLFKNNRLSMGIGSD